VRLYIELAWKKDAPDSRLTLKKIEPNSTIPNPDPDHDLDLRLIWTKRGRLVDVWSYL